jgi:coproporphyrinogen III oxidase
MPALRDRAHALVRDLQDQICAAMEAIDGRPFVQTDWERPGGGGGRTRVLQEGNVFEKAGVNTSAVHGVLPPAAAASMRSRKDLDLPDDAPFFATGVSLVLHPRNPMAPTVHANFRFFQLGDGGTWWFGGGADLTPAYLFEDDATHFHRTLKSACDAHDPDFYPRFKRWCDDYFLIRHRGERRGVGGIFYDDLADRDPEALLAFMRDVGEAFVPAYAPIIERRKDLPFTPEHQRWQQLRRGRYVEFNLVWDRGTVFGLKTDARVESVLMSLPLTARWEVDHVPDAGSAEARLLEVLREPVDWIAR